MKKLILALLFALPVFAQESPNFIQQHRPVFLLFGPNDMNTLVQVSMKYEMWKKSNLYLGYTQTSMWELFRPSSPFRDHNFNPEIFYRVTHFEKYDLTADIGQEHKSNGRDGAADRTYDATYLQVDKKFAVGGAVLGLNNKVYAAYRMFGNSEIKEYLGFWKTGLTLDFDLPWLDHEQVFVNFTPGLQNDLSKSTAEVGTKFRTPFGQDFAPYFYVQYWRGYLATLLDYNVFGEGFRFGVILYR